MKRTMACIFVAAILAALSAGCVQDPTGASRELPVPSAAGVYIINEGNFGRGNASLSYYDLESFHVFNDVFASINGRNLGDVAAEMSIRGARGYIVVNNSQKIEVIDLHSNVNTGTISTGPGSSPRHMAFVNDTLALVTDLYANAVLRVDIAAGAVTGSISVGANPEGIAIAHGKAYVANSGFGAGNTVSVIALSTMQVTGAIPVADYPNGVLTTPGGMLYVVCTGSYGDFGDPADDTPARIVVIDPMSDEAVDSVPISGHATAMAVGLDGIGYVVSTDEVVRVDTRVHKSTGVFKRGTYYAVGVESTSGDIYLSDPLTYVQPGIVFVFGPNGQLRTQFEPGLIPGSFAFKR